MTSFNPARFTAVKAMLQGGSAAITCAAFLGFAVATPASAQVAGSVYDHIGSITTDTVGNIDPSQVTVNQNQTVIRWNPSGVNKGAYVTFLEEGKQLQFNAATNVAGEYTVLNQFVTASGAEFDQAISIDGAISSSANGNIWFQNGAGIYVNSSGSFDVGALLLTASKIEHNLAAGPSDSMTGSLYGTNGEIRFTSTRTTDDYYHGMIWNESTLNAKSRYVAIVAPNIVQRGTVTANGSIAYVVAEEATISMNEGLFDITVTTGSGTDDLTLLSHSGQTLVSSSSPNQNIYMVAVHKNDAISMLVNGKVGFVPDNAAVGSDGSIILSAGRNIVNGRVDTDGPALSAGDISFSPSASQNSIFNGEVSAHATRDIQGSIQSGTSITFANNTSLSGDGGVRFTVNGALTMGYENNPSAASLTMVSRGIEGSYAPPSLYLSANGGTIQLDGDLTMIADSSARLASNVIGGGTVTLEAIGGQIRSNSTSQVRISANANAASDLPNNLRVTGGAVYVTSGAAGSIDLNGLDITANGLNEVPSNSTVTASAGIINITAASGSSITVDDLTVTANGGVSQYDPNQIRISAGYGGLISSSGSISATADGDVEFALYGTGDNLIRAENNLNVFSGGAISLTHTDRGVNSNSLEAGHINWNAGTSITANADSRIAIVQQSRYPESNYFLAVGDINLGQVDLGEVYNGGEDPISPGEFGFLPISNFDSQAGIVEIADISGLGRISATGESVDISSNSALHLSYMEAYSGDLTITTTGNLDVGGAMIAGNDIILTSAGISGMGGEGNISSFDLGGRIRLINANPNNPMIIGGEDVYYDGVTPPSAYVIGRGQLGENSRSIDISFESLGSADNATPEIIIRDAAFYTTEDYTPGRLEDGSSRISFISGGNIRVEGELYVSTQGNDVNLNLTAANEIYILTNSEVGTASLSISDGDLLTGSINLSAPRIIAATQSAYDDISSATSLSQIAQRLDENDGFARDAVISAGTINVAAENQFFVQNTGDGVDPDIRRGLVVGEGGLNITSTNSTPVIMINGYQIDRDGEGAMDVKTGTAALSSVTINGEPAASATGFNRQSLMNGCQLVDASICGADALPPETPTETPPGQELPPRETFDPNDPNTSLGPKEEEEEELLAEERESSEMPESLISASYLTPQSGQPLVIDPVTGAANDDMWGPTTP